MEVDFDSSAGEKDFGGELEIYPAWLFKREPNGYEVARKLTVA